MTSEAVYFASLNLFYSLCKQYIAWYERYVKPRK